MKASSKLAAIIFDLDGTLIDSAPAVGAALNQTLADCDYRTLSANEIPALIGGGMTTMMENTLEGFGDAPNRETINRLCAIYVEHYLTGIAEHTIIYPEVMETLEELAASGARMGICTNKPGAITVPVLKALKMDTYFGSVSCGDSLPFRKPDPRHISVVIEELGCSESDAIFVGDSEWDIETARNAGIPVVAVTYGYSKVPIESLSPDAIIDSFGALPDALRRLASRFAIKFDFTESSV